VPVSLRGDISYRTLAIEENARFEGRSGRNEKAIDAQSFVQTDRPQATPTEGNGKGNGTSVGLNPES